jgi:hypothetical protein
MDANIAEAKPRRRFRVLWWLLIGAVILVVAIVAFDYARKAYVRSQYPYGWSHCCDIGLWGSLKDYAAIHGGRFPAGQATPEASLSLLYRARLADGSPEILRGKTVPESIVREILERGELLGPDTCGWHYVEGLTLKDDRRLALFWDKAGLDHNGRRMPNGDRYVGFIGYAHRCIPGKKWE